MKKFFALYQMPMSLIETWRNTTSADQRKAAEQEMMQAWMKWMKDNEKSIVDPGGPLGKTKRITGAGVADTRNDLTGYTIVQAESHEDAVKIFNGHPHLRLPQTTVDLMELVAIPGMSEGRT